MCRQTSHIRLLNGKLRKIESQLCLLQKNKKMKTKEDYNYFIQLAIYFPNNSLKDSESEKNKVENFVIKTLDIDRTKLEFVCFASEYGLRPLENTEFKYPILDCWTVEKKFSDEPLEKQINDFIGYFTSEIDAWEELNKDLEIFLWLEVKSTWRINPIVEAKTLKALSERNIKLYIKHCEHEVGLKSVQKLK